MKEITPQQFDDAVNGLPKELREAIEAHATAESVYNIGNNNKLSISQIGILADETGYVMVGLVRSSDFVNRLKSALGLDNETVSAVTQDINAQIFTPIRGHIQNLHPAEHKKEDKASPVMTPDSVPATAPRIIQPMNEVLPRKTSVPSKPFAPTSKTHLPDSARDQKPSGMQIHRAETRPTTTKPTGMSINREAKKSGQHNNQKRSEDDSSNRSQQKTASGTLREMLQNTSSHIERLPKKEIPKTTPPPKEVHAQKKPEEFKTGQPVNKAPLTETSKEQKLPQQPAPKPPEISPHKPTSMSETNAKETLTAPTIFPRKQIGASESPPVAPDEKSVSDPYREPIE